MLLGQLKEKHTDRIVIMTVTELITAGIKTMNDTDFKGPTGAAVEACFRDIISGSWNEIRNVIKRSL